MNIADVIVYTQEPIPDTGGLRIRADFSLSECLNLSHEVAGDPEAIAYAKEEVKHRIIRALTKDLHDKLYLRLRSFMQTCVTADMGPSEDLMAIVFDLDRGIL